MPNLHLCFPVMKRPQSQHILQPYSPPSPPHIHHHNLPPTTTTSTSTTTSTTTTLIKSYNSLYEDDSTTAAYYSAPTSPSEDMDMAVDEEGDSLRPTTLDLTAIYASRRFFISSPGMSNSIVDSLSLSSPSSSSATSSGMEEVAGGIPVQTYSPNPYVDFRRSMQEMVEARDELEGKEAWDYLQELLSSYLSLNPQSTHKYIVGAFADLVASLLISPTHFITTS